MVKFGVIGAGKIAHDWCTAAKGIGAPLYAVASRDLKKATTYKELFDFEVAYGSYEALLEDPNVDCVYVATPHGLHFDHMMLALEYNKNILCEKAFTLNEKQAKIVFDLAKEKGLFVMEALWTRFLPTLKEVKRLVENGLIGDITEIKAGFCFNAKILGDQHRLFAASLGGGALLDVGVYVVNFAHIFLGLPDRVESTVNIYHTGVDLSETLTLHYPNAIAHLKTSIGDDGDREAYIYGTKGYVHMPLFWSSENASIYDNNHKLIKEISNKHLVNGLEYEIIETMICIANQKLESDIMPASTTLGILNVLDEIRRQWQFSYPQEV